MNNFHVTSEFYNGLNNYSHEMHSWHDVLTNLHHFTVNDAIQVLTPITNILSTIILQMLLTIGLYYVLSYVMYEKYTLSKVTSLNTRTLQLSKLTNLALWVYLITLIIFIVAQILIIVTSPTSPAINISY